MLANVQSVYLFYSIIIFTTGMIAKYILRVFILYVHDIRIILSNI